MNNDFKDITSRLGEPKWFDKHGFPRYCVFKPDMQYNIYADYVALLSIACQSCGKKMKVAASAAKTDIMIRHLEVMDYNIMALAKKAKTKKEKILILSQLIEPEKEKTNYKLILKNALPDKKSYKGFRTGDPPHHNNSNNTFCHVGGTMGADVIKILQFWEKDENYRWVRNKKHEITYNEHYSSHGFGTI